MGKTTVYYTTWKTIQNQPSMYVNIPVSWMVMGMMSCMERYSSIPRVKIEGDCGHLQVEENPGGNWKKERRGAFLFPTSWKNSCNFRNLLHVFRLKWRSDITWPSVVCWYWWCCCFNKVTEVLEFLYVSGGFFEVPVLLQYHTYHTVLENFGDLQSSSWTLFQEEGPVEHDLPSLLLGSRKNTACSLDAPFWKVL